MSIDVREQFRWRGHSCVQSDVHVCHETHEDLDVAGPILFEVGAEDIGEGLDIACPCVHSLRTNLDLDGSAVSLDDDVQCSVAGLTRVREVVTAPEHSRSPRRVDPGFHTSCLTDVIGLGHDSAPADVLHPRQIELGLARRELLDDGRHPLQALGDLGINVKAAQASTKAVVHLEERIGERRSVLTDDIQRDVELVETCLSSGERANSESCSANGALRRSAQWIWHLARLSSPRWHGHLVPSEEPSSTCGYGDPQEVADSHTTELARHRTATLPNLRRVSTQAAGGSELGRCQACARPRPSPFPHVPQGYAPPSSMTTRTGRTRWSRRGVQLTTPALPPCPHPHPHPRARAPARTPGARRGSRQGCCTCRRGGATMRPGPTRRCCATR